MPKRPFHRRAARKPHRPRQAQMHWGGVAKWYDDLVGETGSEYQREVVLPGVVRLLAPQPGQTIVDIACGQGVLCRQLAGLGVTMTGIDASKELIALAEGRARVSKREGEAPAEPLPEGQMPARQEPRPPEIRFRVGDARDLSFLPADHFDAAACVLAIQNIRPIAPVFEGVARILKPRGRFVIAMMHPAFRSPGETSWGWDQTKSVQYRRVDRYLLPRKQPIVAHPGKSPDVYTWTFHKPIEAYVKAARSTGLLIDALEEWASHKTSTSGPRAAAENAARKEIPMFLALRAVKIAGLVSDQIRSSED